MRTFLITWNPERWPWKTLDDDVARVAEGKVVDGRWSTGNRKDISRGDRLFLLRQGVEPRGIMASGWATSEVFTDEHYDDARAAKGDLAPYVSFHFERLLDLDVSEPLSTARLITAGPLADVHWSTPSSGIQVPPDAAALLEELWAAHVGAGADVDDQVAAVEGEVRTLLVRHRARERRLRNHKVRAVLAATGALRCEVPGCGFDFAAAYGDLGVGYAEVHHLDPLGERGGPSATTLDRLAVVCANCHAMLHRGGQSRGLGDLRPHSRQREAR